MTDGNDRFDTPRQSPSRSDESDPWQHPRMLRRWSFVLLLASCSSPAPGPVVPECGSNAYTWRALLPGPAEAGFDAALAAQALGYERQFHAVNAASTGVTADVSIDPANAAANAQLVEVVEGRRASFDLASVKSWGKAAGLYAGAGIAADAWRYGTLRDQGGACAELEAARADLVKSLGALHLANEITGVPGVIARGFIRRDLPGGEGYVPVPLFDEAGHALPLEKNNGTWRADRSGRHPDYVWEDSCSRDMYVGWALAYGAAWEVVRDDATIPGSLKTALRADATALVRELRKVRASGYDLEIPDADGRTTLHGYVNENNFDREYLPGVRNGFYALMALGIVGALASVAGDAEVDAWIDEELIGRRRLPEIVRDTLKAVYLGRETNGSNVNMAFTAMWLAQRHLKDEATQELLAEALQDGLYAPAIDVWRPVELGQSLFDFVYAAHTGDGAAVSRGVATLAAFTPAPYFSFDRVQCDEAELASGTCTLEDGTQVELAGEGRGDVAIARDPLPMRRRPPSNYWWRSDPYTVNGRAEPGSLLSAVDFRVAYWLGRWTRAR